MRSWLRKPKIKEESTEEKFLLENGGWILEELITSCDGKYNPIRIFSAEELQRATDNYAQHRILHQLKDSDLYEGTYENHTVLVKKFKGNRKPQESALQDSINEIVIASQINHGNLLKLLGYFLETEIPIHVYEFAASKGILIDRNYEEGDNPSRTGLQLPWETRLRIATDIADAVTYFHMFASKPIIHRDITPSNIFLDRNWAAKLSNFTQSKQIPLGKRHVTDGRIRGTVGFVAPECYTGYFTVTSDVFSFGTLLVELLTGRENSSFFFRASSQGLPDESYSWHDNVKYYVENNRVSEIVAPTILEEGAIDQQQLRAFVELALRCTEEIEEERPTMLDVAKELRRIRRSTSVPPLSLH